MSSKSRPCEVCDRAIEAERVEAIPETRLCVEHARMIGKYGGEFLVTATRESLGKAGSLKKNYGDIATHKTRNRTAIERLRREHLEGLGREAGGSR
jgi:RNA polymerase-binding transcription factor DksA